MFIVGASGHGKVILDSLTEQEVKVLGFYDLKDQLTEVHGIPVMHQAKLQETDTLILGIGDNQIRKKLAVQLSNNKYGKAIHPKAVISPSVEVGKGTVIMASATINIDTKIGRHAIINTAASIDHDCVIGDFVHIAPNATLTGGIQIGEGSFIGAGAVILPNIKIGEWCTIGAGSVVTKDVPDGMTVKGNPAK